MEGEGKPVSFEGDLGPVTPEAHTEISTPRTIAPEEGWQDETVEGGAEVEVVSPSSRQRSREYQSGGGCTCDCPRCPEECPPLCACAGHLRHSRDPLVTGDEPY